MVTVLATELIDATDSVADSLDQLRMLLNKYEELLRVSIKLLEERSEIKL